MVNNWPQDRTLNLHLNLQAPAKQAICVVLARKNAIKSIIYMNEFPATSHAFHGFWSGVRGMPDPPPPAVLAGPRLPISGKLRGKLVMSS